MKNIKLLICDVDGVLTDGSVYLDATTLDIKAFYARDGQLLKYLPELGISVLFLTGRKSAVAHRRAYELNTQIIDNVEKKRLELSKYLAKRNIAPEVVAYIGDDLNDYSAMKLCGFRACPADAVPEIKSICDYVSNYSGGRGAVRDICEYILKQSNKWAQLLRIFEINAE